MSNTIEHTINTTLTDVVLLKTTVDKYGIRYMNTVDIAEIFNKRHDNVIRDIRALLSTYETIIAKDVTLNHLRFNVIESSYTDSSGRVNLCYVLDMFGTIDLIMGYDRATSERIMFRWLELESDYNLNKIQARTSVRELADIFGKKTYNVNRDLVKYYNVNSTRELIGVDDIVESKSMGKYTVLELGKIAVIKLTMMYSQLIRVEVRLRWCELERLVLKYNEDLDILDHAKQYISTVDNYHTAIEVMNNFATQHSGWYNLTENEIIGVLNSNIFYAHFNRVPNISEVDGDITTNADLFTKLTVKDNFIHKTLTNITIKMLTEYENKFRYGHGDDDVTMQDLKPIPGKIIDDIQEEMIRCRPIIEESWNTYNKQKMPTLISTFDKLNKKGER